MKGFDARRGSALWRGLLAGGGLLALALAAHRFSYPPDLGWDTAVLPLAALGLACLGTAPAIGTPWWPAAKRSALYLVAQACALQLIDTDRYANYAHYAPWSGLGIRALWLAPVAAQWAVGLAALRSLHPVVASSRSRFRIAAVLVVIAFGAAVPTVSLGRYAAETALAVFVTLGALCNLGALVVALPEERLASAVAAVCRRLSLGAEPAGARAWDRRLPWIAAAFVATAAAVFARLVLGGVPHIDDSISNLFQARTFALGRLAVAAPPDSAAFHVDEVLIDGGRWFGYGFPGWPAILAAGVRLGLPWIANPLLAGATVLLNHRLLLRLHGPAVANQATLLLAASPWLLFMSAEMMGHPLALVLTLATLLCVQRARSGRRTAWAVAAGFALGALALTRPLDAAVLGFTAATWLFLDGARTGPPQGFRRNAGPALATLIPIGLAAAAVASLLFAYNRALTGDPFYTPQMMWTDRAWGPGSDRFGFGAGIGIRAWPGIDPLPGHGPADVVLNLNKNLFAAGTDLFGWAGGSLVLVLAALAIPDRLRRGRLEPTLLLTCVVAYSAYWFAGGPDLGPRYWYLALPAFVLLSILGARRIAHRTHLGARIATAIALACVAASLTFVPWRAATRYYRFRDIGDEIRRLERQNDWRNALVLVRGDDRETWQAAFNFLDPTLEGSRPVFARLTTSRDGQAALFRRFPDRPVWIVGTRPGPDRRLHILAGPLPPGTLAQ